MSKVNFIGTEEAILNQVRHLPPAQQEEILRLALGLEPSVAPRGRVT